MQYKFLSLLVSLYGAFIINFMTRVLRNWRGAHFRKMLKLSCEILSHHFFATFLQTPSPSYEMWSHKPPPTLPLFFTFIHDIRLTAQTTNTKCISRGRPENSPVAIFCRGIRENGPISAGWGLPKSTGCHYTINQDALKNSLIKIVLVNLWLMDLD